jgi:Na+-transporting NADH:ubiquinone oxidoreductase subunit NqrF
VEVVFDAELWIWDARRHEMWTFVSVPADHAEEIRDLAAVLPRGFGSVRVQARIGTSIWKTSIFPAGDQGAYVLPVKKAIRKAQSLNPGDKTTVAIELIDF